MDLSLPVCVCVCGGGGGGGGSSEPRESPLATALCQYFNLRMGKLVQVPFSSWWEMLGRNGCVLQVAKSVGKGFAS